MAFYKKLIKISIISLFLIPLATMASVSKYWSVEITIRGGQISSLSGIEQRVLEDFDPMTSGDYNLSLFYQGKLLATNNVTIPETFDTDLYNLDGSHSTTQGSDGNIYVYFKAPGNFQINNTPNDPQVIARLEKDGKIIIEEKLTLYDYDKYDTNPTPPVICCAPNPNPKTAWYIPIIAVLELINLLIFIILIPTLLWFHHKNKPLRKALYALLSSVVLGLILILSFYYLR